MVCTVDENVLCPDQENSNMLLSVSTMFLLIMMASLVNRNPDLYLIARNWNRNANGQSKGWLQEQWASNGRKMRGKSLVLKLLLCLCFVCIYECICMFWVPMQLTFLSTLCYFIFCISLVMV